MMYDNYENGEVAVGNLLRIATFTTPSIQIAGRELNPIAELTVGDIAGEFLSITETSLGPNEDSQTEDVGDDTDSTLVTVLAPANFSTSLRTIEVNDATGRKVLRAFRDAVGIGGGDVGSVAIDREDLHIETGQPIPDEVIPDWDGDTYSVSLQEEPWEGATADDLGTNLRFDKHEGDFVVLFEMTGPDASSLISDLDIKHPGQGEPIVFISHPSNEEFRKEMLQRHLNETNLRGMRGLVSQARKLIDETQELLGEAIPPEEQRQREKFHSVVTDTQDDLKRLDTIMGGLGEDLQAAVNVTTSSGSVDNIAKAEEKAEKAETIATRAHERVANYNDTRNEEDDRFVQIERNLNGLRPAVETVVVTTVLTGDAVSDSASG